MLEQLTQWLLSTVLDWGYFGIFSLMAIESSFIPFPSEVVLIPAGYLAYKGDMSVTLIFLCSLVGSMIGSFINYYLAYFVGRKFLLRYGNYFFISEETLVKMETFFQKHGAFSTFSGRLIPGVRQLISIPAGLSKMDIKIFSFYTAIGAGMWSMVLIALGYILGENEMLIKSYLHQITLGVVATIAIATFFYVRKHKTKKA